MDVEELLYWVLQRTATPRKQNGKRALPPPPEGAGVGLLHPPCDDDMITRLRLLILFSAATLAAFTAACTSFSTHSGQMSSSRVAGIFYFLPRAKVRVVGSWVDPSKPETSPFQVTITTEMEADPKARYYLKPDVNVFYDDHTHLAVNAKGLLITANATAEDRTPQIVADIAATGANAFRFAAGGGFAALAATETKRAFTPFDIVFRLDEIEKVRDDFKKAGFKIGVTRELADGVKYSARGWGWINSKDENDIPWLKHGVVFRPWEPVQIDIEALDKAKIIEGAHRYSAVLMVPDEKHPLVFDYSRMPFVKKVSNVTFVDGCLHGYESTRPSSVLGFLQIPKAVMSAIAPLPLEIKNTQISNIEAQKKLDGLLNPQPAAPAPVPVNLIIKAAPETPAAVAPQNATAPAAETESSEPPAMLPEEK